MKNPATLTDKKIGGKDVYEIDRKVLNLNSGFKEKQLCDGPTFTSGDACRYKCLFCYVPSMGTLRGLLPEGVKHEDVIVRRRNSVTKLHEQLTTPKGTPKFDDPKDTRVIYGSPLVDVAANMEMVEETVEICKELLKLTNWHIRLLSKSNLLPKVAALLDDDSNVKSWARERVIYGVSTGTANPDIAKSFELDTPLVTKRIDSLHWLQSNGFRTFGMICPSLPRPEGNYQEFSAEICELLRINHPTMEHVWAEVINVRGDSLKATAEGLRNGGHTLIAEELEKVSGDSAAWEEYNRATFLGHKAVIPPEKLRFLTYVSKKTLSWWEDQEKFGAVLLGKAAHGETPL